MQLDGSKMQLDGSERQHDEHVESPDIVDHESAHSETRRKSAEINKFK